MGLRNGKVTSKTPAFSLDDLLPAGLILPYGGDTAPAGFALCQGQAVSRTTFARAFAALGTKYGVGDGSTTFNLPNGNAMVLRGPSTQSVNGRTKTGPAVGAVQEDRMQRLTGSIGGSGQVSGSFNSGGSGVLSATGVGLQPYASSGVAGNQATTLNFNSANSPNARVSATDIEETRVTSLGVNYIVKL